VDYELGFVRFVCKTYRHCIDAWFCIATKSPKKEDKSDLQAPGVLRRKRKKEKMNKNKTDEVACEHGRIFIDVGT